MGWFGPRGLASIVFAVIVIDKQLPHAETITMTAVCIILLSKYCHSGFKYMCAVLLESLGDLIYIGWT